MFLEIYFRLKSEERWRESREEKEKNKFFFFSEVRGGCDEVTIWSGVN